MCCKLGQNRMSMSFSFFFPLSGQLNRILLAIANIHQPDLLTRKINQSPLSCTYCKWDTGENVLFMCHGTDSKNIKSNELYVYTSHNNLQHVFNIDQMGSLTNYTLLRYISNMWISIGSNIQFGSRKMILPYVNFPWVKKMKRDILFELANLLVMHASSKNILTSPCLPFSPLGNFLWNWKPFLFCAQHSNILVLWRAAQRKPWPLAIQCFLFLHVSYSISQGFCKWWD